MNTRKLNGIQLDKMLRNGLANLQACEQEINDLNVFPVADGDTGTNMALTLENGLRLVKPRPETGAYLKQLSEGMLLGARGNSGVILSQIFRGIFWELCHAGSINVGDLRNAFIRGYKTAYSAVAKPAEGTILTVAREGIERIREQIDRNTTVEMLLSMYLAQMQRTLAATPDMLPALREAGVVDSGALGYIRIVEGMQKYLYGEKLTSAASRQAEAKKTDDPAYLLFNENSSFEDGYCMEFLLQLMNGERYAPNFRLSRYMEELNLYGSSLVAVQEDRRVRVHIHTLYPAKVITASQEYGEFLSFKLENMQLQHNETLQRQQKPAERKPLVTVAVAEGSGMLQLFRELGCEVIDGGATMNPPAEAFTKVFRRLNAGRVVVLPNNKNTVAAAEQAVSLCGADNITVLPTDSMPRGYFAAAMDDPGSEDTDFRLAQMKQGAEDVQTLSVTFASKDYSCREIGCKAGDAIALLNGELCCVGDGLLDVLADGLDKIEDMDSRESCVAFRGADVPPEEEEALSALLAGKYPCLELQVLDGGQKVYHWLLGVL